jgi:hypothetical protein
LLRLAEEVQRTREARLLVKESEVLAVVMPVSLAAGAKSRRMRPASVHSPPTAAEIARSRAGILAGAGSWKNLDAEAFKAYVRERRRTSSRPPVRL